MHVTLGPDSTPGAFLWLLTPDTPEPPPTGAHAFTGPGTVQEVFFVSLCSSGDCESGSNNGKYYVDNLNPDDVFVVVTAMFSK
jgi:hypothetical protein